MAWAEVYFRTKWRRHPSRRLATIDMGRKLRAVPLLEYVAWAEVCIRHLDSSSHSVGHNRHGPKIGWGLCFFFWGELGPLQTQSPELRPTSIPSGILINPAVWPQQIWPKNGGLSLFGGGGAGSPSNTMWPGPRPTCLPSFILIEPTVWPPTSQTNRTDNGQIA